MSAYLSFAPDFQEQAKNLMKRFGFLNQSHFLPRLHWDETGLCLLDEENQPQSIHWNDSQWKHRAKGASGTDPLIRATSAGQKLKILDLTAGWGKDGLLMAQAGAHVILLEKNPYMAAMLEVAHQQLKDSLLQSRIQVVYTDAKSYLHALMPQEYPQVIYIDPMHPKREKTAKVKKHLQVLQTLVPPNEDVDELITLARSKVLEKVVLKWPAKKHPPIPAHHSYLGKTIRYDVYLPNR